MSWTFKSDEDLTQAGYVFKGVGKCRHHRCGARILWYLNPDRNWIPINPDTWIPHFITCPALPDIREKVVRFRQGRELQCDFDFEALA